MFYISSSTTNVIFFCFIIFFKIFCNFLFS
nr:MAG TPA: hypothetical protein [Bacteriophage sp.]